MFYIYSQYIYIAIYNTLYPKWGHVFGRFLPSLIIGWWLFGVGLSQYKWIVKCHGKEMAICRWILYDELKWLNSLLAKAIRHARHVLKSVCDWLWAFQMCAWTKICVPQLVGGLEHVLFFHNILNNPSHWLSYFSEGLKPPTR